jgi:hypothetical protein
MTSGRRNGDHVTGIERTSAPSPAQLWAHALRQTAGAALVLLAAAVVHRTGHADQQWQYVAIAGATAPQLLLDVLALHDPERRARLRVASRPAWLPGVAAVVLTGAAVVTLLLGQPVAPSLAGLCAAAGLAVTAAPPVVALRSGGRGATSGREATVRVRADR